jgi:hypothetical protein
VLTGSRTALCGGKSEELCEDVPPNIGHCQRLLANGVVFALDRSVRDFAFVTFQDGQESLVAPIDIIAQLKLTVFVDKGGLIGHVDRYENCRRTSISELPNMLRIRFSVLYVFHLPAVRLGSALPLR